MSKKNIKREKDPEPSQQEDDPEQQQEDEEGGEAVPTGHDESLRALAKPIMAEFIGCFFFLICVLWCCNEYRSQI